MACGVLFLQYLSPLLRRSAAAPALPGAAIERRWGVVQPVGHLTVNEDGEGSNPSAPANFPFKIAAKLASDGLIPLLIPISSPQNRCFPTTQYLSRGDIIMGRRAKVSLYRLLTIRGKHRYVPIVRKGR